MSSDEIANQHIQLEIEKAAWDKKQKEKKTEIQHVKIIGVNVPFFSTGLVFGYTCFCSSSRNNNCSCGLFNSNICNHWESLKITSFRDTHSVNFEGGVVT